MFSLSPCELKQGSFCKMQRKAFDTNEALCHSGPLKPLVSLCPPIQPGIDITSCKSNGDVRSGFL